jgi:hypothetical protein
MFLAFLPVLAGCGSTRIVSQDPNAEIFLDDQWIGVGEAHVDRVGPPRHAALEARKGGRTVGKWQMSRSFTGMTVVWGLCSYYTGFYWGWYYPKEVTIPLTAAYDAPGPASKSPWMEPGESVWMRPLK